jgi:hypothetical protein
LRAEVPGFPALQGWRFFVNTYARRGGVAACLRFLSTFFPTKKGGICHLDTHILLVTGDFAMFQKSGCPRCGFALVALEVYRAGFFPG